VAELEYGVRNSGNPERESSAMRKILVPFEVFDFDAVRAARLYGSVRQELESSGTPIGSMDLLIGAHALSLGAVLVTHNTAHLSKVPGLVCEDWTRDSAPSGSA
jgi:tRNA(fMet)-specific endonuclease VapC